MLLLKINSMKQYKKPFQSLRIIILLSTKMDRFSEDEKITRLLRA